jgi:hypothetical protein
MLIINNFFTNRDNAYSLRAWVQSVLVLTAALLFIGGVQAAENDISEAEHLLFETNHLKNLTQPGSLLYTFKKAGQQEKGFDDLVNVDVSKVNASGSKTTSMRFLTGERKTADIPPIDEATGNPVILGFLERDLIEMKRLTGGATNYFRKRIRMALFEKASVKPVTFTHEGKALTGTEISVKPYIDDPMREKMEKYANKHYVFVLSEQVPGGVYQIRSSIPGDAADKPAMEETLTLSKQTKLAGKN